MKRVLSVIMTAAMIFCIPVAAGAASLDLTYDLTAGGSNNVTAATGDVITVTYTVHAGSDYSVNAIQNEIKYDTDFFEYVDGSVSVNKGVGSYVEKIAGPRIYMNDMTAKYSAEQTVGTFQLKVTASSGSGKVESTECLAYDDGGGMLNVNVRDLTVTIGNSGSGGSGSGDSGSGGSGSGGSGSSDSGSGGSGSSDSGSGGNISTWPFKDVKSSDWFYDSVAYVYENGLMNGTSSDTFGPNMTTTRGMIVTILYRLDGEPSVKASDFTDVPAGKWYSDAVAWGEANGIVKGYGDGTFGPGDIITREQMAAVLYRYAEYKGCDVSARADLSRYTDVGSIGSWALESMQWANSEGLVTGVTDSTLVPKGNAYRAQAATILMRFCENILK